MSYEESTYAKEGAGSTGVGEDLYNVGGGESSGGGLKRTVAPKVKKLGFHKPIADPRLYVTHDRVAAMSKPAVGFDVSRDDRMSKEEAGLTMKSVMKLLGLLGEKPEVLEAAYRAIFLSHSLNGGSVLQPGRAVLTVADTTFDYSTVVTYLGNSQRRFFRAYADEVILNNKRILAADDPYDIVAQEQAELLRQVAAERGLQRFPYLCHDSADACSGLSDAEHSALIASKAMVFSSSQNMADRARFRPGQSGGTEAGSMYVMPTALAPALGGAK